jgi:GNAT superfamily N-acetyltransferase
MTLDGWAIRRATAEDAAAIAAAHLDSIRSLGPAFYPDEHVARWASGVTPAMYIRAMNGGEVFFVAIDQNACEPVVLGFSSHWSDGTEDGVSVYVRGSAARRGIGAALLRAAESHAVQSGARSLVIEASLAGLDFYKANGFQPEGEPVLLPSMQLLVVRMRKTIGG